MGYFGKKIRVLSVLSASFLCLTLIGCGGSLGTNELVVSVSGGYDLIYNGNVELGKVPLKTDDLNEIIDLYQEVGDNVGFRDSLLIAEKYDQGLGINAFTQDNLDTLKDNGLTITDIKKTQLWLKNKSETVNAVLVEYKITGGLIEGVPLLYVSQLFIPSGHNVELLSFITESSSSHSSAVSMFKNIN